LRLLREDQLAQTGFAQEVDRLLVQDRELRATTEQDLAGDDARKRSCCIVLQRGFVGGFDIKTGFWALVH